VEPLKEGSGRLGRRICGTLVCKACRELKAGQFRCSPRYKESADADRAQAEKVYHARDPANTLDVFAYFYYTSEYGRDFFSSDVIVTSAEESENFWGTPEQPPTRQRFL